jgi:hypothetical protein
MEVGMEDAEGCVVVARGVDASFGAKNDCKSAYRTTSAKCQVQPLKGIMQNNAAT